jgi:Protein of unknown function (DUF1118)
MQLSSFKGAAVQHKASAARRSNVMVKVQAAGTQTLRAGTQKLGTQKLGTRPSGKPLTSIEVFSKEKLFRPKQVGNRPAPKILSRVQELRLLSKAEQAGLLSLAEKNGITLTFIEQNGLLSKAESLGLISAAADPATPNALFTLALGLLAVGPALVYFVPDSSTALVAAQVLGAIACIAGGSAAWGGASLLASLQKTTK